MWTGNSMGLGDSLVVSLMGLATVFLALVFLSLAVVVVSKLVGEMVKDKPTKPVQSQATQTTAKPTPVVDKGEEELYAVIIAAISEEMRISVDKFKILSITEL